MEGKTADQDPILLPTVELYGKSIFVLGLLNKFKEKSLNITKINHRLSVTSWIKDSLSEPQRKRDLDTRCPCIVYYVGL